MTANINPETGIAYGYISARSLHDDVVQELQDNGTDVYYADAVEEAQQETARELSNKVPLGVLELPLAYWNNEKGCHETLTEDTLYEAFLEHVKANWSGSDWEQKFNDAYQPDEPIHEGEKDGVKYRTSWLGGALNVWVFESPHTARTVACSPCVPNAGDLDNVGRGDYLCYDVPPDWRDEE
jgi:hypothetical protein